ncbi:MAG: 2OG-Fe(II) oxygenase [Chitinophagaceae bacterium]|nr:2OG-Fe(II) oxygenase [Chitinophagaceae bacterium]
MIHFLTASLIDNIAEKGFGMIDNFLTTANADGLLTEMNWYREQHLFKTAGIGSMSQYQKNKDQRGDNILWVSESKETPFVNNFLCQIDSIVQAINKEFFLGIKNKEFHFTFYPVGSFYKRHKDQFYNNDARKISIVCYLNKTWTEQDGGQLRLYDNDGSSSFLDIFPIFARLVCFRSDTIEHEVLPASKERLSITGWLRSDLPSVL